MSANASLALLLDGPMQAWGHNSRFERRTTALHPTRSGVFGMIAAALGIDKHGSDEAGQLARFAGVQVTTVTLPRKDWRGDQVLIQRLEDYHTVTGIRRASGKVDKEATVQTYRHYLLDARFGVLLEGPAPLLEEIAASLRNPVWGVWLGRKSCLPATPVLAGPVGQKATVWSQLLTRAGYSGSEPLESFDRVVEVAATDPGAEAMEDQPLAYGGLIGERHTSRWIQKLTKNT